MLAGVGRSGTSRMLGELWFAICDTHVLVFVSVNPVKSNILSMTGERFRVLLSFSYPEPSESFP